MEHRRPDPTSIDPGLPLLCATPASWARLAADNLGIFLSDHAVCEQQAALAALHLIAHYPEDAELVDRMSSLAAEEVMHLRRVARLLHDRGLSPAGRRPNRYVRGLHDGLIKDNERALKLDRLLVGALIEARSCERFTCLLNTVGDEDRELAALLQDLGPAEQRHWEMFYRLAGRETTPADLEARFGYWLERDRSLMCEAGTRPTVHG